MNPSEFLDVLEGLRARLSAGNAPRLIKSELLNIRAVVGAWFSEYQTSFVQIVGEDQQIRSMDEMMQDLLKLASGDSARKTVIRAVSSARQHFKRNLLVPVSRAHWSQAPERSPAGRDDLVAQRLRQLDGKMADGYEQALLDIEDGDRLSYRGPANELREVLTFVLHTLAPNSRVEGAEWYKEAKEAIKQGSRKEKTPTRAERTRFILRSRTDKSVVTEAAESYMTMVEDRLGHVVGKTFERGNAATHAGAEQAELVTLLPYVNALLRELLPTGGTVSAAEQN